LAMDLRKIKKLIEMLEESNLSEIEIKEGEECVRLSRQMTAPAQPMHTMPMHAGHFAAAAPLPAAPEAPTKAPDTAAPAAEGQVLRSPMVGTFYTAQAPGQPLLAKLGQVVKVGDTLGIVEAMKMFNPIESEFAGTIIKLLVENGSPVEFDQPLMVIG
jgi:acetyl-CoA carboxylase biotin carboxyl carrier protein